MYADYALIASILVVLTTGCLPARLSDDVLNSVGYESRACFKDKSCNSGLVCLSDVCRLPSAEDADGDGFKSKEAGGKDCDDRNKLINPKALEICGNTVDENCDNDILTGCKDSDGDGYVDKAFGGLDCDDGNIKIHPAAVEICGNDVDENCDNSLTKGCDPNDTDGDGVADDDEQKKCSKRPLLASLHPEIYPGAPETCCARGNKGDSVLEDLCDRNCDGKIEFCSTQDQDGDGVETPADCDDTNKRVFPGAPERCDDGVDQDCDGRDLKCSEIGDRDGDHFSSPGDCNDRDASIYPDAPELCDGKDNDCDGIIDNGNPGTTAGDVCTPTGGTRCSSGLIACFHVPNQRPSIDRCYVPATTSPACK